jgi:hypothetical protein
MPEHRAPVYEGYDVLAKWDSPSFDAVTREVLHRRLAAPPPPRFFTPEEFATLEAACARLLATARGEPPLANWIDADLAEGRTEGFRHPEMPPIQEAWRLGLRGLDAQARRTHGHAFVDLEGAQQDETLRSLQRGQVDPSHFERVPAAHFFTHLLLKAAASHFYAQPAAWNEIGFGGPASPRGYVRIGLDRRDPWEAPLRHPDADAP